MANLFFIPGTHQKDGTVFIKENNCRAVIHGLLRFCTKEIKEKKKEPLPSSGN